MFPCAPSPQAHSLGEASAENKGHGPETSRDADGQDRYSRHKAVSPVAEGNTSTSRGAKTRQGRGLLVSSLHVSAPESADVAGTPASKHCLCPLPRSSGGGI